jgi:hypothetical protein
MADTSVPSSAVALMFVPFKPRNAEDETLLTLLMLKLLRFTFVVAGYGDQLDSTGPVAPVYPVAPVEPVAPVDPVAPVGDTLLPTPSQLGRVSLPPYHDIIL